MNPTIRPDILAVGRAVDSPFKGCRTQSPNKLIAHALAHLSLERASFAPFDNAKDAEIKEAIRNWLQSWVIPPLEYAFDKTAPEKR